MLRKEIVLWGHRTFHTGVPPPPPGAQCGGVAMGVVNTYGTGHLLQTGRVIENNPGLDKPGLFNLSLVQPSVPPAGK